MGTVGAPRTSRLRRRLQLGTIGGTFAAVLLFGGVMATLLGAVLIRQLAVVNQASVTVGEVLLPSVRALEEIAASTARYRVGETNYLMASAQPGRDQAQLELDAQLSSIDANQAIYEPAIRSDQERRVYGEFMTLWASYLGEHFQLLELVQAGKIDDAKAKMVAANRLFTDVQAKLSELVRSNAASVKSVQRDARQAYERSRTWALWILAGLVIIGGGFSGYFARRANTTLRQVSFDLHHSCDRLMTTAREAAGSAESLARASTDQTATVSLTSASMEQIASATRRNAGDSREAAALVVEAARRVMSSNDVLAEMLRSMEQIKLAGSKVANVAKAIDGIAFQTNLLALNAAVEAARAGDAGLGFGVVADEVKYLAQRAAEAARETVVLIDESMASSQQGAERVAELAVGMAGITDSVERLRALVGRVNEASANQSERLDQMTHGLGEFRRVTETTAMASQESAAASEILNSEVIETLNAVRRLEVLTDGAAAAKPAVQAANVQPSRASRYKQAPAA